MSGDLTKYPIKEWLRRTASYAFNSGVSADMPNGHYANYGGTWVIGVILFNPGSIECRDVPGKEFGFPDVSVPNAMGLNTYSAHEVLAKGA
jgi:hypothetical protein